MPAHKIKAASQAALLSAQHALRSRQRAGTSALQAKPGRRSLLGLADLDGGAGSTAGHTERAIASEAMQASPSLPTLDPVHGNVLPAIGDRVWIRHGRHADAHACIVRGYYAWNDLGGNPRLHRIFLRLAYEGRKGMVTEQARMLCDTWPTRQAALDAKPGAQPRSAAVDHQPREAGARSGSGALTRSAIAALLSPPTR